MAQENVVTTTLDSYAEQSCVARFTLVKIDAEGHDLAVLRGAHTLLSEHRIAVAQFEYNHRWIFGRFYLRDAFEFLLPLGYRVGKLTPRGVEFYPGGMRTLKRSWKATTSPAIRKQPRSCPQCCGSPNRRGPQMHMEKVP